VNDARALRRDGADDTVLAVHFGPMGPLPGGMAQVVNEYLSWDFDGIVSAGVRTTKGRGDRLAVFRWIRAIGVLLKLAVRRREVVALVHISARGAFIREGSLVILCRLLRIPVGIHLHGSEFVPFATRHARLVGTVCRSAGTVFALTDETLALVTRLAPSDAVRKVKIVNAIALPEAGWSKRSQVLFCGEVGTRKGVDVLMDAWRALAPQVEGWDLLIAGPTAPGFVTDTLPDRCELLGPVDRAESLRLQAAASIAVLPSRHEALPMFLIEAMSNGCAVVATDVGQIDELVRGVGVVIPPNDPESLREQMSRLIADDGLRTHLGEMARDRVATTYSAEVVRGVLADEWKSIGRSTR
jgi:glycosyltransferase involved in cell wall biosynthesis